MKKYFAELVGTAALCFIGCGSVVLGGFGPALASAPIASLPIAFAFGLSVTAMAYAIGPISGCHINPAVSVGMVVAGRMPASELPGYIIGQVIGAFVGCGFLALILTSKAGGYDIPAAGLGQNMYDAAKGFGVLGAFVAEVVGTFLFVTVILGATQKKSATPVAGLAIGLTLVIIHIVLIPVTGTSVNPARSLAPAIYVRGEALAQIWLFILAPIIGAVIAGLLFQSKALAED
ncbi:aquaporin [Labrys wisconsinensis]|uniref:Aquaporin Z n=1 Tax=Labrys wisconsinensis TaxID=425677 RepID=A0ABU0JHC2_9HYPH|nr:aquaporin [Labrys wisconsinensis]MDQ0472995.1 aquaporin Z [Labrys wisconsinensis]